MGVLIPDTILCETFIPGPRHFINLVEFSSFEILNTIKNSFFFPALRYAIGDLDKESRKENLCKYVSFLCQTHSKDFERVLAILEKDERDPYCDNTDAVLDAVLLEKLELPNMRDTIKDSILKASFLGKIDLKHKEFHDIKYREKKCYVCEFLDLIKKNS